jgi:monomeric sarcosine oxidase
MHYDTIVLGLGGVGSAALRALAASGQRVLGIDRYAPPHDRGSSHGETRIIRKAYFEHPDYVPMLERSYVLWRQLEERTGRDLMHLTGLLEIGPEDGVVVPGVLRSAAQFDLPIERMSLGEAKKRYRGLAGPDHWVALLEHEAGYLRVEDCVSAHWEDADTLGAECLTNQPVENWTSDGRCVTVSTPQGTYQAGALIVAAGAWAGQVLQAYGLPLRVLHKYLYWFRGQPRWYGEEHGFPCYFFETPAGHFYGFPELEGSGMKMARHSGGEPARLPIDGEHPPDADDQARVEAFAREYLPDMDTSLVRSRGCYYTMTPDENFILDRLPDRENVVLVAGLSGHGFKFTPVLGELAAQLAMAGASTLPIEFLSLAARGIRPTP